MRGSRPNRSRVLWEPAELVGLRAIEIANVGSPQNYRIPDVTFCDFDQFDPTGVALDSTPNVLVERGRITAVNLAAPGGQPITGQTAADGQAWMASPGLSTRGSAAWSHPRDGEAPKSLRQPIRIEVPHDWNTRIGPGMVGR